MRLRKKITIIVVVLLLLGSVVAVYFRLNVPTAPVEISPYSGADPQVFNPAAKEIALFTEEQKKQVVDELELYGRTVKENSDYVAGWLQVGLLKKIIGDYIGARDAWEYAALLRPNQEAAFKNLGELYWHYLPDYPHAEENFEKAIEIKPDDISTYRALSEFYQYSYLDKKSRASKVLKEGLKKNPNELNLLTALGYYYEEEGNYKEAIGWWEKALTQSPDSESIKKVIKEIQSKL